MISHIKYDRFNQTVEIYLQIFAENSEKASKCIQLILDYIREITKIEAEKHE